MKVGKETFETFMQLVTDRFELSYLKGRDDCIEGS